MTPYQYCSNSPIANIELDGLEGIGANYVMSSTLMGAYKADPKGYKTMVAVSLVATALVVTAPETLPVIAREISLAKDAVTVGFLAVKDIVTTDKLTQVAAGVTANIVKSKLGLNNPDAPKVNVPLADIADKGVSASRYIVSNLSGDNSTSSSTTVNLSKDSFKPSATTPAAADATKLVNPVKPLDIKELDKQIK
jgi:hypothetical protein